MDTVTLILGSRGSKSGRRLRFVRQTNDGIEMQNLNGSMLTRDQVDGIILSLGGEDSMLNKCFVFNGTNAEFLALPESKRGICWKTINKKWVDYLKANSPEGVRVGYVIDGLLSQAIMEGKKNGR
jgi:hypothetical protein